MVSLAGLSDLAGASKSRVISDGGTTLALRDLRAGTTIGVPLSDLQGLSVLILARSQVVAAATMLELDGIARRLILCPPGLGDEHIIAASTLAEVDYALSEGDAAPRGLACQVGHCGLPVRAFTRPELGHQQTEWVLFTSGTTAMPKMVVHSLSSLAGATTGSVMPAAAPQWSTFYDIRRYGGLQIFLRAMIGGGSLFLRSADEGLATFLARAGDAGVSHISGTPSHWRQVLMSGNARSIAPAYVRLSGEIADQRILDSLKAEYPTAAISHAFASTEAGVAFAVDDGLAGFPHDLLEATGRCVAIKVIDDTLRIRSPYTAKYYVADPRPLTDADGFVDTGDMVAQRGDRWEFMGRRDRMMNIGGQKVSPDEVEAFINRLPRVALSRVRARRNAITGFIVVAEVTLRSRSGTNERQDASHLVEDEILAACRDALPAHKVPAIVRVVPSLDIAASGKLARPLA